MILPEKIEANLSILILSLILSGCAASPAAIQPDDVSSEMFVDFSCETLRELRRDKRDQIDELSKSQKTKRFVDGATNVLILPGLASVIEDSSKPLARAKGELNALIREYDRRCIKESSRN